jgi:predicted nucleic acid-binding Zn ribbon protein
MPTYLFRNTDTGEVFEKIMKISELDPYKETNPTHERYYDGVAPAFAGDHITIKKDTGFKEVLQRVHEKTPGSQLNRLSSQL